MPLKPQGTIHEAETLRREKAARRTTFDLLNTLHGAESSHLPNPPPSPAHEYTVTLESDTYTDEKYALFEQYQRLIHHEPPSKISKTGFRRFLCDSPLTRETRDVPAPAVPSRPEQTSTANGSVSGEADAEERRKGAEETTKQQLGSYHQLHRLNGRLIGLSVLDLLPHAVSAVYFIYLATPFTSAPPAPPPPTTTAPPPAPTSTNANHHKPTLRTPPPPPPTETNPSTYSPGTLSALREAALALTKGHKYYYMGYHIHACAKMRYKADFKPQYVLDPVSYTWDAFDGVEGVGKVLDERGGGFVSMSLRRRGRGRGEGEEEEWKVPFPTPKEAAGAHSLFDLKLAGVPTLPALLSSSESLDNDFDIDNTLVSVKTPKGRVTVPVCALQSYATGSYDDNSNLKGIIADLVAVLGGEVARGVVVEF